MCHSPGWVNRRGSFKQKAEEGKAACGRLVPCCPWALSSVSHGQRTSLLPGGRPESQIILTRQALPDGTLNLVLVPSCCEGSIPLGDAYRTSRAGLSLRHRLHLPAVRHQEVAQGPSPCPGITAVPPSSRPCGGSSGPEGPSGRPAGHQDLCHASRAPSPTQMRNTPPAAHRDVPASACILKRQDYGLSSDFSPWCLSRAIILNMFTDGTSSRAFQAEMVKGASGHSKSLRDTEAQVHSQP